MVYGKGGSPGTPTPDWDKDWPPKPKPKPKPKLAKKNKKSGGIYGKSDEKYGTIASKFKRDPSKEANEA